MRYQRVSSGFYRNLRWEPIERIIIVGYNFSLKSESYDSLITRRSECCVLEIPRFHYTKIPTAGSLLYKNFILCVMPYTTMLPAIIFYRREVNPLIIKIEVWHYTVIMGSPKKVESIARVDMVKLCSPLSHRVISLGRFPRASANCFLFKPFSRIRASSLLEMAKESRVSSRFSRGISLNTSCNEMLTDLIIILMLFNYNAKLRNLFYTNVKIYNYIYS